ncbi:MAG: hypothetical protein V1494_04650 [Candidatus Diapherotrites archaeon]
MNFLDKIREIKRKELAGENSFVMKEVKKAGHSFIRAVSGGRKKGLRLIAEIKKASPSAGELRKEINLKETLAVYGKYADAVSVVTEPKFFNGSLSLLREVKQNTKLPVLAKDFVIDARQIIGLRENGADAVLLISNLVPLEKLNSLISFTESLGMDAVVECECPNSLRKVLKSRAKIVGINNRDLHSLKVNPKNFDKMEKLIPKRKKNSLALVAESGFSERQQIEAIEGKADAVLVGSALMKARNLESKLKELKGIPLVKICGITNAVDAKMCEESGADFIGFNFFKESPRYVVPEKAKKIISGLKGKAVPVGVFVNHSKEEVGKIARESGVQMLQFSGDESTAFVNSFPNGFKAIRAENAADLSAANAFKNELVLIDAKKEGFYGGTGKKVNAKILMELKKMHGKKVFLAGGITPENVKGILRTFKPYCIDVASGAEEKPGEKSERKLNRLLNNIMEARK